MTLLKRITCSVLLCVWLLLVEWWYVRVSGKNTLIFISIISWSLKIEGFKHQEFMKLFKRKLKVEFKKEWQSTFSFYIHCHKYEKNLVWHIIIHIPFLFWVGINSHGLWGAGVLMWNVGLFLEKERVKQDAPFLTFDVLHTALPTNAQHPKSDFAVDVSENSITITKKATQPGHGT